MTAAPAAGPAPRAGRLRGRHVVQVTLLWLFAFALFEGACQLVYWQRFGVWRWDGSRALFAAHPFLVAVPNPGLDTVINGRRVVHDAFGLRGRAPRGAPTQVAALGGSTTYCVMVADGEEWPARLGVRLGTAADVLNFGVPGYTSVESLFQTAHWAPDLGVDIAVFFQGWNDATVQHVAGLAPDYADYHGRHQYLNLKLGGPLAAEFMLRRVREGLAPTYNRTGGPGAGGEDLDPRALALYRRNLQSQIALCRAHGIAPVFVPQVLDPTKLRPELSYGWGPHIANNAVLGRYVARYNATAAEVAAAAGVPFLAEVAAAAWGADDFLFNDPGHLSPAGCEKLAELVAAGLRREFPQRFP